MWICFALFCFGQYLGDQEVPYKILRLNKYDAYEIDEAFEDGKVIWSEWLELEF